jgi:hypothetical protein
VVKEEMIKDKALSLKEDYLLHTLETGDEPLHEALLKFSASNGWIEKFKNRWHITLRKLGTKLMHPYLKLKTAADEYFDELSKYTRAKNVRYFYNMDETAVFFDPGDKETLDLVGSKRISYQSHVDSKNRITVMLTIGFSGEKLPPMIIIKANKPKDYKKGDRPSPEIYISSDENIRGLIARKSVSVIRSYTAWNCAHIMEKFYVPTFYTHAAHAGPDALLIMDNFSAHFNDEVLDKFAKYKLRTLSLAPNCTSCLQPLDVSIMRPFKGRIRKEYRKWISEQIDLVRDGVIASIRSPKEDTILHWVIDAWDAIDSTIVKKSKLAI